jgi:general secretion pathway protein K
MAAPLRHCGIAAPGQSGFALVAVLWAAMILAAIAASIISTGRTEARLSRTHYSVAQLEAAADAAIHITILRMLDPSPTGRPPLDATQFVIEFGGYRIAVSAQDEAGKINLNMAQPELLRQLLIAVGVETDAAHPLIDKILDWRETGMGGRFNGDKGDDYREAGYAYRPRNGPVESIEELQLVMDMAPALFSRIAPSLTVYSQTPWVDPAFASADVLAALSRMGGLPVAAVLDMRNAGQTGSVMIGHTFTIAAAAETDQLRVEKTAVVRLTGFRNQPIAVYRWR